MTTEVIRPRDVPVLLRGPTELRALAQADLGSKSLGYLDTVLVDRGDKVKRGQVLALIRPSDLPDQLAAARNAHAQAVAALGLARANLERAKALAPQGLVSQQELQAATTAAASAEAVEGAAGSQMAALGVRLGETRLAAPYDGVVTARRLDPGELVGPSSGPILTVARIDLLRAYVAVNEREAAKLALGQTATLSVEALPGQRFEGRVVRLAPTYDAVTRTLEAEIHLENPHGVLRPGMYGRAEILVELRRDRAVVPAGAVRISGEKAFVFVVESAASGDGGQTTRARRRAVRLGADLGEALEVAEGLEPGDEIVTAGIDGLSDGAPVRRPKTASPGAGTSTSRSPGGT